MLLDAQKHYFLSQFLRLDEIFSGALENLNHIDDGRMFPSHTGAVSAVSTRALADGVVELRNVLRRFMRSQDIAKVRQPVDAVWAFRTAIIFAGTTVRELRPEYLCGYGEVDPASVAAISELVSDLQRILRQMSDDLAPCDEAADDAG